MAEKNRTELKTYFKIGKRPTEEQFVDLIDSLINKKDDAINIDGNNNVGIGTANPGAVLEVRDQGAAINLYRATDQAGQYRWRIDQDFEMFVTDDTGQDIVKVGANESWFNSGNMGIGTTSPDYPLEIQGFGSGPVLWAQTGSVAVGDKVASFRNGANLPVFEVFADSGGKSVFNGNVGIGTASPAANARVSVIGGALSIGTVTHPADATLHISDSFGGHGRLTQINSSGNSQPAVNLMASTTNVGTHHWWTWGVDIDDKWKIQPGVGFEGATGLTVNGVGNVGIGKNDPAAPLHIGTGQSAHGEEHSLILKEALTFSRPDGAVGIVGIFPVERDGYKGGILFRTQTNPAGGSTKDVLIMKPDGKIGIGTNNPNPGSGMHMWQDRYTLYGPNSPYGAYLQVGGYAHHTTAAAVFATNGNLHIDAQSNAHATYINFFSQGHTILNENSGMVGIGTGSPTQKLHVNGNALKTLGGSLWVVPSDKRIKKNIKPFKDSLSLLKKVVPVWYNHNGKAGINDANENIGVIAQDIQKIFPYMISSYKAKLNKSDKKNSDLLTFNGSALKFVIINAVKELDKRLAKLESQLAIP